MDPARGITNPDLRRVVREALRQGWEFVGMTGTTHLRIRWPKTGDVVVVGMTVHNGAWKNTATELERISGCELWRRGNRKRSRKAVRPSGFDIDQARRESGRFSAGTELLHEQHDAAIARFRELVAEGDREAYSQALKVHARIAYLEQQLRELCQPFEPFDVNHL
jgi:hypothetical protein